MSATESTTATFLRGTHCWYWLFSHTYTTGSFHSEPNRIPSWKGPRAAAPSPKNTTDTWSVPRILLASAVPVPGPMPPATIPLAPKSSAIIRSIGAPLARQ